MTTRRRIDDKAFVSRSVSLAGLVTAALVSAVAHAQPQPSEGQVIMTPPSDAMPTQAVPSPPPSAPAAAPAEAAAEPPPEPKPPAGYVPGTGFVLQSPDAAYRLRIGLVAAYKFEPVYVNGSFQDRNAFFVMRPFLGGNFFKEWIHFWTSFEFASNPPFLLDSYVEIAPWKEFQLRIGQQWTPFDRHEYFGPQEILFPEWAPVSEYFWTGRDKGVTAMGNLAGQLDYWAGIYSGTPLRQFNALPGNYLLEARLTWNPMGSMGSTEFPYIVSEGPAPFRVSGTLQGYYGKIQSAEANFNPSTFRFETMATGELTKQGAGSADFWLQGRCITVFLDGFVRKTTPNMAASYTSVGLWGQVGVPLIDKTMDIATRINWLNASTALSNDGFYSLEGQLAWYVSHSPGLVVKLRYAYGHQNSPDMATLGDVKLITTAGNTQIGTLQLNLAL